MLGVPTPNDLPAGPDYTFEAGADRLSTDGQGWADVWKRGHFGWECKGAHADLAAANEVVDLVPAPRPVDDNQVVSRLEFEKRPTGLREDRSGGVTRSAPATDETAHPRTPPCASAP